MKKFAIFMTFNDGTKTFITLFADNPYNAGDLFQHWLENDFQGQQVLPRLNGYNIEEVHDPTNSE